MYPGRDDGRNTGLMESAMEAPDSKIRSLAKWISIRCWVRKRK